jgi:site-specific recombinase XerD
MGRNWIITPQKYLSSNQIYEVLDYLKFKTKTQNPYAIRNYHLLRLMLETGLRVKEVTNLEHKDFCCTSLVVRCGKGSKDRVVQLTEDAIENIQSWIKYKGNKNISIHRDAPLFPNPSGLRYCKRSIQKIVSDIFDELGFENLSCHSCRHSYCSNLLAQGVPISTVKSNMGHSSLQITNLYAHAISNISNVKLYKTTSPYTWKGVVPQGKMK